MTYSEDWGLHEEIYLPNQDAHCEFQRSTGSNNYANVDKLTHDDSTYNYATGYGPGYNKSWDYFGFTDTVPDNATNIRAKVHMRCKSSSSHEPGYGWVFEVPSPHSFVGGYSELAYDIDTSWTDCEFNAAGTIDGWFYYIDSSKTRLLTPSDIHNMLLVYTDMKIGGYTTFYVSQLIITVRYEIRPPASFILL